MSEAEKVGQEQIHTLLFDQSLSWQAIIHDLINSEQLDPWNIDISVLANRYLARVRELEEANFFVSSKVVMAASFLLRIKSDILLDQADNIDDILFGRKKEEGYVQERIELEGEVPGLVPRSPLPRFRRVTLDELMAALGQAIVTETRRIKKQIIFRQQEREIAIAIPKRKFNVREHIDQVYKKITDYFENNSSKVGFSELLEGLEREEKIIAFASLLHLDNQQKIWLEQEGHFEEIWILLKSIYEHNNKEELERLKKEVEDFMKEADKSQEESDAQAGKMDDEEPHGGLSFRDRRTQEVEDSELEEE